MTSESAQPRTIILGVTGGIAAYKATEPTEDMWHLSDGRTLRATVNRGTRGGLVFQFDNVSDRLDLERSYKSLGAVQREAFDHLHEGICVFGGDGRLKLFNKAFERLWSLPHELLKDKPDYSVVVEACVPLFHDVEIWEGIKAHITDPSARARQSTTGDSRISAAMRSRMASNSGLSTRKATPRPSE